MEIEVTIHGDEDDDDDDDDGDDREEIWIRDGNQLDKCFWGSRKLKRFRYCTGIASFSGCLDTVRRKYAAQKEWLQLKISF